MSKLAIKGGNPVRAKPWPAWPVHDEHEVEAITEVTRSGKWWRFAYATGVELNEDLQAQDLSKVVEFGLKFARFHDCQYGIAMANGTASLEVPLRALGIGPGDEVIVPAYTYVASATSVLQVNAVPIFVDVQADTYNMDPALLEEAITERTGAIMPVHFGGQSADMDAIMAVAKKHNLAVLEDAAHGHGSEWRGRKLGSIGNAGSFSFQSSKNMTSGEGGIVTTNDRDLAEKCDSLLWAGRKKGRPWYEFHQLGWNYRLTEFQAAILLVQLTRLEEQNARRMANARYLNDRLAEIEGIQPLRWDERASKHSFYLYIMRYDPAAFAGVPRSRFVEALVAEGVPAFTGYTFPVYANPMFLNKNFHGKGCPLTCGHYGRDVDYAAFAQKCPVTERACYQESIWLEHRLFLGDKSDMDDIVEAVAKVKANIGELS
ncbi:MAG: DegT/DnrJ/EryC1/StrS family aminotransferase [Anaerolineae bacterium]